MQTVLHFHPPRRISIHCCLWFICYSIRFAACTLHGVWRYWGRTLLAPAFYRYQLQSRLDDFQFGFLLLSSTKNFQMGLQLWADVFQISQQRQALSLYASFFLRQNIFSSSIFYTAFGCGWATVP